MARKPLAGTVAANVLAYGTGALNIDGCRVDSPVLDSERRTSPPGPGAANGVYNPDGWPAPKPGERHNPDGRWPPNVVLGPAAAAELDRQSGTLKSGEHRATEQRHVDGGNGVTHGKMSGVTGTSYADTGGASRFFPVFRYEAKAAASERPRGVDGTAHPTVKPLDLMRWLVRLVTPPGGTVADFFAGSGTTGEACIVEGFKCILAEKDPASAELIVARLRKPIQPVMFGLEGA